MSVIAEFHHRSEAETQAQRLRAQGKQLAITTTRHTHTLYHLELGSFPDSEEAGRVKAVLKKSGIWPLRLIHRDQGTVIAAGAFAQPENLLRQQQRLIDFGLGEVKVIPLERQRTLYQLAQLETATATDANLDDTSSLVKEERHEFKSEAEAQKKADELIAEGMQVKVTRELRSVVNLHSLQLRPYERKVAAQRAVDKLREYGIDALVIRLKGSNGYAVSAGAFGNQANLQRQEKRIRGLGFENLHVIPLTRQVTRHVVAAKAPQAVTSMDDIPVNNRPIVMRDVMGGEEALPEKRQHNMPEPRQDQPIEQAVGQMEPDSTARRAAGMSTSEQPAPSSSPEPRGRVIGDSAASSANSPSAEGAQESQVLVLGSAPAPISFPAEPSPVASPVTEESGYRVGLDKLVAEAGALSDSNQVVEGSHYLKGILSANWRPDQAWEFQLAGRLDAYAQTGSPDYDEVNGDYGDSFIRYRGENIRFTAGSQTVIWGRVDGAPPTDRLSVQDFGRAVLDDLEDRRRSVPALRMELFRNAFKTDVLWVPRFRGAEMPAMESIWSPVDKQNGRMLGSPQDAAMSALIRDGSFVDEEPDAAGGVGLRLSRAGSRMDYALTIQEARHSMPYYELNEAVRSTLLATSNTTTALAAATGPVFTGRHIRTRVVGGDLGFEAAGATWRFEAAYLSDVPATTQDLRMVKLAGLDWVAGVEVYPGQADTRLTLELTGHHLLDAPALLDQDEVYGLNGSVEVPFARNRWRAQLRYAVGLGRHDLYVNPELTFLGAEPHEFYLGAHVFDGGAQTLGGFYKDNDLVTLGWRANF